MTGCLISGQFIDSENPEVRAFAERARNDAVGSLESAINLYYVVRDEIHYDPYYVGAASHYFRASDCLQARRGFCIPKAALLAACARAIDIPARVGFADVKNHLSTSRLDELIGGQVYTWHCYTEMLLEGSWVKATPAFNLELCDRFGVHPLEFDGKTDSLFQQYNRKGQRHMEYVNDRGRFADVPYQEIVTAFQENHPRWLANRDGTSQDY